MSFLRQPLRQWIRFPSLSRPRIWLADQPAYGIELEYEHYYPDEREDFRHWEVAADGSLRHGGVEFVSAPLSVSDVPDALSEVEAHLEDLGEAEATMRCGLHVHANMRPYTIGQFWSVLVTTALIEPTIYEAYAVGREDSAFAVPLYLNSSQHRHLARTIQPLRRGRGALQGVQAHMLNSCKYSAVNMGNCMQSFGTLEFRHPYCSRDFNAIRSWVEFIHRLVSHGVSFEDPIQVLDDYERGGLDTLQEALMGTTFGIDADTQELAEDAAYFISGYDEPAWEELEWDVPTLEAS